ncbi:MAG: menaquinone biosynthesis protein [Planctomycetaceae bacterium]|nr:menaquinone biosynthesis protein [Planctomycetaceae bacterium]
MNETTLECDTAAQPGSIPLSQVRIGAVSYLNSKPLIAGLQDELAPGNLLLDVPSRLADDLSAGELDVALIPSVEYFSRPDYRIISDACIATRGPVLSVKLYSRVPLGEIRTLALDEGSRTSAVLSRIMLKERFGVIPERKLLPMSSSTTDSDADAILLIGDRAINPPQEKFLETWDLGEEWVNWTGFPFVFAMWVARSSVEMEQVAELLEEARDLGVKSISEIARREAGPLHISVETAEHYLRENLHFQFGSAEWRGLNLFRQLASQLDNPDPFAVGSLT